MSKFTHVLLLMLACLVDEFTFRLYLSTNSVGRGKLQADSGPFLTTGSTCPIQDLLVRDLLPQTKQYITYEGSTTLPGCWETTTWVLSNKPIYLAPAEVRSSTSRGGTLCQQR